MKSQYQNNVIQLLKQLLDAYHEIPPNWDSRDNIIQLISGIINTGPFWSFVHVNCRNDNAITIEGDLYGTLDKNNPQDPIGELIDYFNLREKGVFRFKVPDYNRNNVEIDLAIGKHYQDYFEPDEVVQLSRLLTEFQNEYRGEPVIENIELLQHAIRIGEERTSWGNMAFTRDQQYLIKLFTGWVFLYGMWMRFWKGPGQVIRCEPQNRDKHI